MVMVLVLASSGWHDIAVLVRTQRDRDPRVSEKLRISARLGPPAMDRFLAARSTGRLHDPRHGIGCARRSDVRSTRVLASLAAVALALLLFGIWRTQEDGAAVRAPIEPAGAPEATLEAPASDGQAADESSARSADVAQRDALNRQLPAPTCPCASSRQGAQAAARRGLIQREDVDRDGPEWWRAMRRFNDVGWLAGDPERDRTSTGAARRAAARPVRTPMVAAARGSLHGTAAIEPRDETCIVELKPYHALTIEVVDRAGKPCRARSSCSSGASST
jgi:hypothetical protein